MKKEKILGIYRIINIINNKIYIGCSKNIHKRIYCHKYMLRKNKHENSHLQRSYNIYGENQFVFEIIETCEESEIYSKEHCWINFYDSCNKSLGYSIIETTGTNKRIITLETRLKMSKSRKGVKFTDIHCINISKGKKGMIGPNLGKLHTEKTKQKIKTKALGRKHSEETKNKMSIIKKGIPSLSIKSIEKFSKQNVLLQTYLSIKDASKCSKISRTSIINNLKNRSKTAGGFIWKYKK